MRRRAAAATVRGAAGGSAIALPLMVTLGALTLLGPFGTDAYLPALPVVADELAAAPGSAQLSLSGFTLGMAAGQLLAGPLSDGLGRRTPLLVGSAAMAVAGVGASLAPDLLVLVLCCAAMGLGASAGIVVSRAIVSDLADGPSLTRSYALLGVLTSLGPVLSPAAGVAVMAVWGWRGIFAGLGILAAACLVAVALIVPESLPPRRRIPRPLRGLPRNAWTALRTRTYLGGASVIWFSFAALFAYIAASSFLVQTVLGLSAVTYSMVFAINGVGLVLAGVITTRLSGWWREHAIMALGLTCQSVGAVLVLATALTGTVTAWTLLPALFLVAASMGFLFGPATAYALHGLRHVAGTAVAVIGSIQFVAAGIVSPLVGIGGEEDPRPFAIVLSVCVALAWIGWAAFRERPTPAAATG